MVEATVDRSAPNCAKQFSELIAQSQQFLRKVTQEVSSVSLRDASRCVTLYIECKTFIILGI